MTMTNALENLLRDHIFRTATWSKPTVLAVGLIRATRGYSNTIRSTAVSLLDTVIPATPNGRIYRCTTAGTTGAGEPTWPTTSGGTVSDGTAVWTEMTPDLEAGTNITEVSGGAYARVQRDPLDANWRGVTDGQTDNVAALTFPAPSGANWGVIWGMGVWTATTAGTLLLKGALTTPKTVNDGDPAPSFAANAAVFSFD